jgi:hypothetical protein
MTFKNSVFRGIELGHGTITEEMADILTRRDDIWAGISFQYDNRFRRPRITEYRILTYNTGDEERVLQQHKIKPRHIWEYVVGHGGKEKQPDEHSR